MFEASVTWDKKTIAYDKSIKRGDGIYPDTILWGVAINGCCNPHLSTLLEELTKMSQSLEEKAAEPSVQADTLPECEISRGCYFGQDGKCLRGGECR